MFITASRKRNRDYALVGVMLRLSHTLFRVIVFGGLLIVGITGMFFCVGGSVLNDGYPAV
jgi:hypothetical protein